MAIRRFTTITIVTSILALVFIAALNVIVDPYAQYGTDFLNPLVVEPRRDKFVMLRDSREIPDVLILGSSRAITLRPSLVTALTGRTAFNTAVTRAMPLDYYVYANYALSTLNPPPSTIVVGIDLQALHPTIIWNNPNWLDRSPLKAFAGTYTRSFDLETTLSELFSARQLRDSLRALQRNLMGEQVPPLEYTPSGEIPNWESGTALPPDSVTDRAFWESFTHIPVERFEYLDRLFALANDHGTELIIVFMPYMPSALAELQQIPGYAENFATLQTFLAERQALYGFQVVDLTDVYTWGGLPDGFVQDYYHMNQANADLVIDKLFGADALANTGAS